MFNRTTWIYVIIFAMVLAPSLLGIAISGQAGKEAAEIPETEYAEPKIKLYVSTTGEILDMGLEEYVIGVMMAEAPSKYRPEVLKAVAVAVRSRCVRRLEGKATYTEHFSADFCTDNSHCMGYISLTDGGCRWGKDRADVYYKTVEEAVIETRGQIMIYDGEAAECIFHVGSKWRTEDAQNIWGFEVPYLTSVSTYESPLCESKIFTEKEAAELLESEGIGVFSGNIPLGEREDNENGRCSYLTMFGRRISGMRVREIFGLASCCFSVSYGDGEFLFETEGSGHGAGLSMEGAEVMAKEGKTYEEILETYYVGAALDLFLGGNNC